MEIRIRRNNYESAAGYTIGRLYTEEGGYLCDTLEDENRGLRQEMPLSKIKAIKVYGKTAIPSGRYMIKLRVSPSMKNRWYAKKYGGKFPYLCEVPGFEGVMIHPGNTPDDVKGCICPGVHHIGDGGRITESVIAYQDLMDYYIFPANLRGEIIWLTIE